MIERIEISKEAKEQLVNQIKKFCGNKPLVYLKFTTCQKYANDIVNGKLYANTAKYFREQELKTGQRGQGDQFELENNIDINEFTMTDFETGQVISEGKGGTLTIRYTDDDKLPLVSFVGVPLEEMDLFYADKEHAKFLFPFSDEEFDKMASKFGKYCVIIDGRELEEKINKYANENHCEYIFDKVNYCLQNTLDRIMSFQSGRKERFLYKNKDLEYQREYRLALAHTLPDDHYINIGKLDKASIVESENLKTIGYTIYYDSYEQL